MDREPPRQFVLDLDPAPRYGADDYLVTPAVAAAHALVASWPGWPQRALLVAGPPGAGKSHLASLWSERTGAAIIPAARLGEADLAGFGADAALVVEDVDGAEVSERALFHLMNLTRERPLWTLLTSGREPTLIWPGLPDLASRLRALPVARLEPPDDALMRAVLVKLFHDRQLAVEEGVVDAIARHIDRSIGAARQAVAAIDREALAIGRRVGRRVAMRVIARLHAVEDDDDGPEEP